SEVADQARVARAAARALDGGPGTAPADARDVDGLLRGRGDAVVLERGAALLAHPVGGPGGRQARLDAHLADAVARQHLADVFGDLPHRGAAGVGRRDDDDTGVTVPGHV